MPDQVLLLSYTFPPMWPPEAVLSAKRMGTLPGLITDVICAAPFGQWSDEDHSLEKYVSDRFGTVHRLHMPGWVARIPGRFELLLRSPDELRFLNRQANSAVRSLPLDRYAAVVTWSQWHSVHLVGLATRKLPGAPPWIAHFSDPWTRNPLDPMRGVRASVNNALERRVFRAADRLLFTSEDALELSLRGYRDEVRAKAGALPHSFETSLFPSDVPRRSGPFVLRYVGQFYGARSPEPLFAALRLLRERVPDLFDALRVEFVGRVEPSMLESPAAQRLPDGLIRHVPPVTYIESLRLVAEADLLLVIDAPMAGSPFLPSKLVDYVGAGRPILGITPPGPSASLIRRLGGWLADPSDPKAVADALASALAWLRADRHAVFGDPTLRAEYSADRVGCAMSELIRSLRP